MQNYMLERLLERISISKYKNNFIIKGGFLISTIVGLDTRATMDLDTTIKGFTLTHESIRTIFNEISKIEILDDVHFELVNVIDIRNNDDYPGVRVSLNAIYSPINVPLTVDVTTGDIITPREIEYNFPLIFENRIISILAYNLETVLAEKIETILSRNITNTRPRDFYDIYILYKLRWQECNPNTLLEALKRTTKKRGSQKVLETYPEIILKIRANIELQNFYKNYQKIYDYAKDISFDMVCDVIENIMNAINC